MNELKGRGVEDVLIAIVDGLKGFSEAITAVVPLALVQTCVVHLIRHALAFVSYKDRKAVALKQIYKAKDADTGCTKWTPQGVKAELEDFSEGPWGKKYPPSLKSWRRNWSEVIPFFAFPDEVRRIIYTTNAIESLNAKLRRAVKNQRALSQRRERPEALVPGVEPGSKGVENATARRVHGQGLSSPSSSRSVSAWPEVGWPAWSATG